MSCAHINLSKPSILPESLAPLVNPDNSKKTAPSNDEAVQEGGEKSGAKKSREKKALTFSQWESLLFQACTDFLLALINIKMGSFPSPLPTGAWTPINHVRERAQVPHAPL